MKVNSNDVQKCSICEMPYIGMGHNAEPVNSGRCCDTCNSIEVIPARLNLIDGKKR